MNILNSIKVYNKIGISNQRSLKNLNKLNNSNIFENNKNMLEIMILSVINKTYITSFYPELLQYKFDTSVNEKILLIMRDITECFKKDKDEELVEKRCKKLLNIILKINKKN
jgi:hypothetical protein